MRGALEAKVVSSLTDVWQKLWVTVFGRVKSTSARNQVPRPTQPEPAQAQMSTRRKLVSWGRKQAYRVTHQPVSVVSQCSQNVWLSGWLAETSAD